MNEISRRDALRIGGALAAATSPMLSLPPLAQPAGAAGAGTAGAGAGAAGAAPVVPQNIPDSWVVRPFGNHQVTLGPSLFATNRDRILNYARAYPADRMLAVFRANAGLDTRGAQPPGGWETADGNLRGHFAGHFLSCLSLAYAGSGEAGFKEKLDYMITALGECQDALDARVGEPAPPAPPVARVPGRFGRAVNLIGAGQHIALPAGVVSTLTATTISVWVNPAATTTWSRIFDLGTGTARYMFLTVNANGAPRFAITTSGSGAEQRINGTAPLPTNQWTHLAVTLSAGTGTLYVNGAPVASNTAMTLTPADLGQTGNNWLGRSQFGDPLLRASIDDFAIYDHALNPTEIQALAGGATAAGNVVSYTFDEADGDVANDSSGNGRHASVVRGPGGSPGPSHRGFLAAYPETQFILLEQFTTYPSIWAPWYTCHMIMRGLLDAYQLAGNQQALDIALGMAEWAHSRLAHLPRAQLDRMWRIYIAGEYNAMAAVLSQLHAITGNEDHIATARAFINTYLFDAAVRNEDILDGLHANQHIPQFLGYLELFEQTGERDFFTAAANFWEMVVPHRTYTDGGMAGSGEIFGGRDEIIAGIGEANAETCPCYNMLKLSRQLFFHNPDPKYMQYYERALYGQILASRRNLDSTTNPLLTYFVPMRPGARRSYGNTGTCCGGTGLESHTKFQDSIYFRSADGSALYVNLYLPSTLHWAEKGFTVEQATAYPTDPSGATTLTIRGSGRLDVKLRVPYWVRTGFVVRLNGTVYRHNAAAGSYLTIARDWADGDTITISMPFSLRAERALDDPSMQSIAFGPVPLVARNEGSEYLDFSFYKELDLTGDLNRAIVQNPADPMAFSTHGNEVRPFYIGDTEAYHAYFHRHEPQVVFGAVDSGVPNVADADGFTFLDRVWDRAPFSTQGQLVQAVARTLAAWRNAGLFTVEQQMAVLAAAIKSRLD
ncbi:MAG TPA: beta-L-arabinofuranosidase domain-containing protein [Candidatus Limnocylindrales bacterium]